MESVTERVERTLSTFKSSKIMTIEQLSGELGISSRNTRRHLKKWGALTSYNRNGRFYAHPEVIRFDGNGIWSHVDIHFSRHGNLRDSFVALVRMSKSGLSGSEAGRILRLNPQSFVSHFRADSRLRREKICGRYVYFSANSEELERQKLSRLSLEDWPSITDAEAVFLLVEMIRRPSAALSEVLTALEGRGVQMTLPSAERFLEGHGILKKT